MSYPKVAQSSDNKMSANNETSRSIVIEKFGGYDTIKIIKEFPLAPLEPSSVEVQVEYGGVNFADLYTRQGLIRDKSFPFVLGMECSGTVTAIGTQLTEFQVGQKVICYNYQGGMYRDVVRVPSKYCFPLPDAIDLETGAAVFVNYLTAYVSLFELGNLKEDEEVLILSCTGGGGLAATQLAKTTKNVKIFGTGSTQKKDAAKKNGVDQFYLNEDLLNENSQKFDLIISNQTGPILNVLQSRLKPLGRIVILGANNLIQGETLSIIGLLKAWWTNRGISIENLIVNSQVAAGLHLGTLLEKEDTKVRKILGKIFGLIVGGKIAPQIHSVLPFEKIVEATQMLAERRNVGKVLIAMRDI